MPAKTEAQMGLDEKRSDSFTPRRRPEIGETVRIAVGRCDRCRETHAIRDGLVVKFDPALGPEGCLFVSDPHGCTVIVRIGNVLDDQEHGADVGGFRYGDFVLHKPSGVVGWVIRPGPHVTIAEWDGMLRAVPLDELTAAIEVDGSARVRGEYKEMKLGSSPTLSDIHLSSSHAAKPSTD